MTYHRYFEIVLHLVAGVSIVAALVWLASMPGRRARRRGHPRAGAISALGWCGLICPPLWLAATWWSRNRFLVRPKQRLRVRVRPRGAQQRADAADLDPDDEQLLGGAG